MEMILCPCPHSEECQNDIVLWKWIVASLKLLTYQAISHVGRQDKCQTSWIPHLWNARAVLARQYLIYHPLWSESILVSFHKHIFTALRAESGIRNILWFGKENPWPVQASECHSRSFSHLLGHLLSVSDVFFWPMTEQASFSVFSYSVVIHKLMWADNCYVLGASPSDLTQNITRWAISTYLKKHLLQYLPHLAGSHRKPGREDFSFSWNNTLLCLLTKRYQLQPMLICYPATNGSRSFLQ